MSDLAASRRGEDLPLLLSAPSSKLCIMILDRISFAQFNGGDGDPYAEKGVA